MTRSELQRFVRKTIGGHGRVWYRGGKVSIGYEMDGRPTIMATGDNAADCVRKFYDATRKAAGLEPVFERPAPKPAPRLSLFARLLVFLRGLFARRKALPS